MTGYAPNYELLDNLGIKTQADEFNTPAHNEDSLESNLSGVYLAGVVNGGLKTNRYFIENTRHHADVIIRNIELKESLA